MDLSDAVAEAFAAPLAAAAVAAGRAAPLGDPEDAEADTISASNPAVELSAVAALALLDAAPFDAGAPVCGWLDAAPLAAAADVNPLAVLSISRAAASGLAAAWASEVMALAPAASASEAAAEASALANG
jgi:hypothetical protein